MGNEENAAVSLRATTTRVIRRPMQPSASRRWKWSYAGLSLVLGVLLWTGIDLKRMDTVELAVDIELRRQLPAGWNFVAPPPPTAKISVRGSRQETANIRKENLMVEPDFGGSAFVGDFFDGIVALTPSHVRGLPPGVEVTGILPETIPVSLTKMITRFVSVEPGEILGTPAPGYVVGDIRRPDPPAMPISGPKRILDKIAPTDSVRTKPFNVDGAKGLIGAMVGLEPFTKDGETVDVSGFVYLAVELVEIPAVSVLDQPIDVKAMIEAPFDRYEDLALQPPSVKVTVSGPQAVIEQLSPGQITVFVDIRDRLPASPGEFNIKCRALAPERVHVAKIEPDTVKWITKEASASAPEP